MLGPLSLVGTDSHTPMINGIGVMGWGVGGIEAEAVMLGQPYYMSIPEVIGVKLTGTLKEGVTATDLVLTITEMLRKVRAEGASVTEAAGAFGMSRFSFYQAQSAFEQTGLPGLTPKKPGPRGRHKLTPEVLAFVREELAEDPSPEMRELPDRVQERFGLRVHQRTIERALSDAKKKPQTATERNVRSPVRQAQDRLQD